MTSAGERRQGTIKLSDRREFTGEIWFTDGRLRMYEGEEKAGGRYVNLTQSELAGITFFVKSQTMEHPWRFKNAGSDEKEILPGEYPLVNFGAKVKLASGKELVGHLMTAPVFMRIPGPEGTMDYDNKKFVLKFQVKGEVGQTFKDLAYVDSIVFTGGGENAADNGVITGTITNVGKLEQVAAFGAERMASYPGKVDAQKGSYRIENLPKDVYDIAFLTDRGMYVGLSDAAKTVKNARPLEEGDAQAIAKTLAKFDDFFDQQEVLAVKGHRESAKTLVHQWRQKEMHDEEGLKGKKLHRLDIWVWHLRTTEWHLNTTGRAQLFRYSEDPNGQPRRAKLVPELGGVKLDPAEKKTVELNHECKDN